MVKMHRVNLNNSLLMLILTINFSLSKTWEKGISLEIIEKGDKWFRKEKEIKLLLNVRFVTYNSSMILEWEIYFSISEKV